MLWKAPRKGETRIKRKFALLPYTNYVGKKYGERITVWLSFYQVHQTYHMNYSDNYWMDDYIIEQIAK